MMYMSSGRSSALLVSPPHDSMPPVPLVPLLLLTKPPPAPAPWPPVETPAPDPPCPLPPDPDPAPAPFVVAESVPPHAAIAATDRPDDNPTIHSQALMVGSEHGGARKSIGNALDPYR